MKNRCSPAPGPSGISSLALKVIWDVDEGNTYDVRRSTRRPAGLIALRTLNGRGEIVLRKQGRLELNPDTLIVMENANIQSYRCPGRRWRFWWFEFTHDGPAPFPLHQVMSVPPDKRDDADFRAAFRLLRKEGYAQRSLATAMFAMMLCRWLALWQGKRGRAPHQDAVERVIDMMHERIGEGWTVSEMARAAHLSVRRFRQVFHAATGQAPKAFYDRLRVNLAERMLRQGTHNVAEVASRLGFSSPFHFSKSFRNLTGKPPSAIRAGLEVRPIHRRCTGSRGEWRVTATTKA